MFLAVFQGVVHENTHQLLDLVRVAVVGNVLLYLQFQLFFLLKRLPLKGQCRTGNGFAQREVHEIFFLVPHFQLGQVHHLAHQHPHSLRLRLDIAEPFVLPDLVVENVHIGGNDRQGRFQFVSRIGDKLPLAFKGFLHGTHGSFGQDHGQQKYHALHQQEHQNADQQHLVQQKLFRTAVGKYYQRSPVVILAEILQAAVPAVCLSLFQHVVQHCLCIVLGVVFRTVQPHQRALGVGKTEEVVDRHHVAPFVRKRRSVPTAVVHGHRLCQTCQRHGVEHRLTGGVIFPVVLVVMRRIVPAPPRRRIRRQIRLCLTRRIRLRRLCCCGLCFT